MGLICIKEELVLKKEGVSPGNICILSAQLRNTIACGRWATAGQTSETRITPYLLAGITAPLKAYPQLEQVPIYSNQTQERNIHIYNKNLTTSRLHYCS